MTADLELTFEAEPFDPDRTRTLAIVARWIVRDLIAKDGLRSPTELTDAAFAVLHPELGGRKLARGETALIADYNRITRELVTPLLGDQPAPAPASGGKPPTRRYHVHERGLSRYSIYEDKERLETTLRKLMQRGVLTVSDDHIDTFQRVANVETGGGVQALNTWDSAVVSIGFFQLTLQFGELQKWIARAPDAFARYGIALDPGRTYLWGKGNRQIAIKGAATKNELRWGDWADRFYRAGLDPEIIAAEVVHCEDIMVHHASVAKRALDGRVRGYARLAGGSDLFWKAYVGSLPLRGLYQEARNNRPAQGLRGIYDATKQALAQGVTDPAAFYALAKRTMYAAFVAADDAKSGKNIVAKTAVR